MNERKLADLLIITLIIATIIKAPLWAGLTIIAPLAVLLARQTARIITLYRKTYP